MPCFVHYSRPSIVLSKPLTPLIALDARIDNYVKSSGFENVFSEQCQVV